MRQSARRTYPRVGARIVAINDDGGREYGTVTDYTMAGLEPAVLVRWDNETFVPDCGCSVPVDCIVEVS